MKFYKIFSLIGIIILVLVTIQSAIAYDIDDNEDTYIMSPGDNLKGVFIITDFNNGISVETDLDWISFEEDANKTYIPSIFGNSVSEGVVSVPYFITIPKDVDIGVYRTTIKLNNNDDTKYLNIKISVQNRVFGGISKILTKPTNIIILTLSLSGLLLIYLVYFFIIKIGGENGKKN